MNWINFEKKSLKSSIKWSKKAMQCYFAVFILSLAGVSFYGYALCHGAPNRGTYGYGLGVYGLSALWMLFFCFQTWEELRGDIMMLKVIAEIETNSKIEIQKEIDDLKKIPNCS